MRRRDAAFGTGLTGSANGDLVLRSPVRGFSIPRAEFEETFYVRMYDGSGTGGCAAALLGAIRGDHDAFADWVKGGSG